MEEGVVSSRNKKILFIGLFIVPFLAGMALIFKSKGIGTLPYLSCEKVFVQKSHKDSTLCTYKVNEFSYVNLEKEVDHFSSSDSSIYVVNFYPNSKKYEWEKSLQYNRKVLERYSNCKILSLLEEDSLTHSWSQDPSSFFSMFPNWIVGYQTSAEFHNTLKFFNVEINDSTGYPKYVIVDKAKNIRAFCLIDNAKDARDIPEMLKVLNNQYAPRKIKVERKD